MSGALSGNIRVPGVGEVKKGYALAGVAAVVVLIIYTRSSGGSGLPSFLGGSTSTSGSGTAAATTPTATYSQYGSSSGDPFPWDGTTGNPSDPYSMDPNTGVTYGDEGNVSGTSYGGGGSGGGSGGSGGPPFGTNAEWSQYAIAQLTGQGMNATTVTNALGSYIAGQPVDTAQEQTINDAIAVAGQPPVSGPGGYPPAIHVSGGKGHSPYAANPVTGISAHPAQTSADITWHPAAHAGSYQVTVTDATGRKIQRHDVTAASTRIGALQPGRHYHAVVLASPARPGAPTARVTFTTLGSGGRGHHHGPTKTVIANGAEDLHSYALHNGVTEAEIVAWNPGLAHLRGTRTHVPKGTRVRV